MDTMSGTGSHRILCPVVGCPEASSASYRHFRDFNSIKNHLNEHCTGHLAGAIPISFLSQNNYSTCSVCNKVLHIRYNGSCPKCRPRARTLDQVHSSRNHINAPRNNIQGNQLPSLFDVHKRSVPIIKSIPLGLRRLWAQCLTRAFAQAVWSNDEASWIELQMLPKCTLCRPTRGGKSHKSQKLAWTRGRLNRWLSGDRAELWDDLPPYRQTKASPQSEEAEKRNRQDRCISLTGEGGFSKACKALVDPSPLGHTPEVLGHLKYKHPSATSNIDMSSFGNASDSLVSQANVVLVERCIRSFHRLSGGGPSGLKPIHLKNCLNTEHCEEIPRTM